MAQELEKARVTEIKVRMDCNGCVHKIKKALRNIDGIYDVFTDYPQQKVTVVGRADPEKILKAIKKTRKVATICSHVEPVDQPPNPTPETEEQPAAPDTTNNPPSEPPPAEAAPAEPVPAAEPAKEEPPPQQSTAPEASPPPAAGEAPATSHPVTQSEVKDVGEIHMVHHYPDRHGYGYSDHWNSYPGGQVLQDETHQVIHSYNSYRPSPYVSGYSYLRSSPPRDFHYREEPSRDFHYRAEPSQDFHYRADSYRDEYNHSGREGSSGGRENITSMFSDENPNACSIV